MNALGEMVLGQGEAFHAKLVSPAGFEPATHSLEGCCSVQLSYGEGGWSGREDSNLRPPAPKAGALPDCATPRRGARKHKQNSAFDERDSATPPAPPDSRPSGAAGAPSATCARSPSRAGTRRCARARAAAAPCPRERAARSPS